MSYNSEVPVLREYKLLVKPPKENKIKHRIYANSPEDAKEQALKRWPDSKVIILGVKKWS
tara:strand:+ start:394 stop:573 length:180 start_codon:yes stop_codon:yes gene_type:complete